jgi:hypothetical protein
MSSYLYVIVNSHGQCWAIRDGETEPLAGLPSLFNEGWRPVREAPFHGGPAAMLILLERD